MNYADVFLLVPELVEGHKVKQSPHAALFAREEAAWGGELTF
jgi:hypothetical protein